MIFSTLYVKYFFLCLFLSSWSFFSRVSSGAAVHKHSPKHVHTFTSKERESDGAYSPKQQHYDENGNHLNQFDHEAILGSVKEAETFDELPPQEAKRRLAILLKKMDTNNDGFINRPELKAWILKSFRMLSEEEAAERLDDADENHDGKISWDEYLSETYGVDSVDKDTLQFHEDNLHLISEDKDMWNLADKDHDGLLDSEEYQMFANPEDYEEMASLFVNQTLQDKDKDGDGAISFQEYIGDRGRDMTKDMLYAENVKFNNEFDLDKDGRLTDKEILKWIVPSNNDIASEEVLHLFAHSDDDHDDLLSYEEVLDHYETFVGSEATDYGDHLHNIHQFDDEL